MGKHNTEFLGGIPGDSTDATQFTLASFTTRPDHTYHVKAVAIAKETVGGNEAASYERKATFHNDGGTLALVGAVTAVHSGEVTAGWDVTLDASGSDIRLRATGAAATNIHWEAWLEVSTNDGKP